MNEEQKDSAQIILSWWREHLRPKPEAESGTVRAFRARLRRADRAADVMMESDCVALYERLVASNERHSRDPLALAALLPVLALVQDHSNIRFARACGGDEPVLSRLRFQRLIRINDHGEFANALRRNIPLLERATCNVAALSYDFLRWNSEDDNTRERVRTRWCFDYFGKTFTPLTNNASDKVGNT